ncbi:hypothetical protein CRG98_008750 [Punica granatum]|uniref:GAG-pre-integrase domain-containing protein n=1 Tax=Punica granatum TaxID=22663 RepID=A0A2I0KQW9_PUNGR|nr:hypothetical protein CRG98_008750 [Punica granatum]
MQIEDYLYGKDLWQPLEDKPIGTTDAEWSVLDRKAMSMIHLSLSRSVAFHTAKEKTTKGAMVVARGKKEGTLYMTVNSHDSIALASANSDADLWHYRLGHMSEKGMKQLCSKGKLPGLKTI